MIPLNTTPDLALKTIIDEIGLERTLLGQSEGEDKVRGINALVSLSKQFKTIPQMLFMIEKMKKEPKKKRGVQMMSVHASKGLEFKHVFVVDVDSKIFPHEKSEDTDERRLFYVAITRAIEGLHIYGCGRYVSECELILSKMRGDK
jgi:DNA helicase-2/ATP-dependent DNA helicase PcrA